MQSLVNIRLQSTLSEIGMQVERTSFKIPTSNDEGGGGGASESPELCGHVQTYIVALAVLKQSYLLQLSNAILQFNFWYEILIDFLFGY